MLAELRFTFNAIPEWNVDPVQKLYIDINTMLHLKVCIKLIFLLKILFSSNIELNFRALKKGLIVF